MKGLKHNGPSLAKPQHRNRDQVRVSRRWATLFVAMSALVLAVAAWWVGAFRADRVTPSPSAVSQAADAAAAIVGSGVCAECHTDQTVRWRGSMHARAMAVPSASSVAAPFAGEAFTLHGTTSTFFRRDGKFFAHTDGPDGAMRDFEVAFTFGTYPLQQYLIALPGGRLQALGISWDARPRPKGQRWYHLYPSSRLQPGDVQHWTSRSQTWNYMCADCHSTNVEKRYIEAEDRYETRWSEVNVACEACHGPGSQHVAWARRAGAPSPRSADDNRGLTRLGADGATWVFDPGAAIAHRSR